MSINVRFAGFRVLGQTYDQPAEAFRAAVKQAAIQQGYKPEAEITIREFTDTNGRKGFEVFAGDAEYALLRQADVYQQKVRVHNAHKPTGRFFIWARSLKQWEKTTPEMPLGLEALKKFPLYDGIQQVTALLNQNKLCLGSGRLFALGSSATE